jgi:hypothetical protein
MDEPAQPVLDGATAQPMATERPAVEETVVEETVVEDPTIVAARWAATLPPAPFAVRDPDGATRRFARSRRASPS